MILRILTWPIRWWSSRVRVIGRDTYIRFAPNLGFAFSIGKGQRIRWARHHGLQLVTWRSNAWIVSRQLAGRSRVKGERHQARSLPPVTSSN